MNIFYIITFLNIYNKMDNQYLHVPLKLEVAVKIGYKHESLQIKYEKRCYNKKSSDPG